MNSPKLGSTPVKRLGIMRRKSSPAVKNFLKNTITPICSPFSNIEHKISESFLTPSKLLKSLEHIESDCSGKSDNEILQAAAKDESVLQLERKLHNLGDVSELDEAINMWRTGCKEALLELQAFMKAKEDVKISCKTLSKKLGIWSVIKDNFETDSEIVSSDEDEY